MKNYVVPMLVLGMLATVAGAAEAATKCSEKLGTHSYTCERKDLGGGTDPITLQFGPGSLGGHQVTVGPFGIHTIQCICETTGTFKAPKFDQSPTKWFCLGTALGGAEVLRGTVAASGKLTKVSAGLTLPAVGDIIVPILLNCTLDSATPTVAGDDEDEEE